MAFIATETVDFEPLAAGDYLARCVTVAYLGLQRSKLEPQKAAKPKIALEFEIQGEFMENGLPLKLMAMFTMSLHKQSSLRPFLETWRGQPFDQSQLATFDVSKLLNVPAKLIIVHKAKQSGGVRAVIQTAFKIKPEQKAAVTPALSPLLLFDADSPDPAVLEQLPKFFQEQIAQAEKPAPKVQEPAVAGFDDDLDF